MVRKLLSRSLLLDQQKRGTFRQSLKDSLRPHHIKVFQGIFATRPVTLVDNLTLQLPEAWTTNQNLTLPEAWTTNQNLTLPEAWTTDQNLTLGLTHWPEPDPPGGLTHWPEPHPPEGLIVQDLIPSGLG